MTLTYAEKKLRAAGFAVRWELPYPSGQYGRLVGVKGRHAIEMHRNGTDDYAATIRMRSLSDHDEPETDYSDGSFYPSLSKAIATAARWQAEKEAGTW